MEEKIDHFHKVYHPGILSKSDSDSAGLGWRPRQWYVDLSSLLIALVEIFQLRFQATNMRSLKEPQKRTGKKLVNSEWVFQESCQVRVDSLTLIMGDKNCSHLGYFVQAQASEGEFNFPKQRMR